MIIASSESSAVSRGVSRSSLNRGLFGKRKSGEVATQGSRNDLSVDVIYAHNTSAHGGDGGAIGANGLSKPRNDASADAQEEEDDGETGKGLAFWFKSTPWLPSDPYEINLADGQIRTFDLNVYQKTYLILDSPKSW
jgi:hypothetical protein